MSRVEGRGDFRAVPEAEGRRQVEQIASSFRIGQPCISVGNPAAASPRSEGVCLAGEHRQSGRAVLSAGHHRHAGPARGELLPAGLSAEQRLPVQRDNR